MPLTAGTRKQTNIFQDKDKDIEEANLRLLQKKHNLSNRNPAFQNNRYNLPLQSPTDQEFIKIKDHNFNSVQQSQELLEGLNDLKTNPDQKDGGKNNHLKLAQSPG